jgi:hypothetical protein
VAWISGAGGSTPARRVASPGLEQGMDIKLGCRNDRQKQHDAGQRGIRILAILPRIIFHVRTHDF